MLKNDVLLRNIARLVAQTYALKPDAVYQRFMEANSIDSVIQEVQQPDYKVGQDQRT